MSNHQISKVNYAQPALWLRLLLVNVLVLFVFPGFSQSAKRVISLAPSLTETIYLLGAQKNLIGCTSYCSQGVSDGKEIIGTTVEVNVEKIFSLKPDLVLTMELTKPQDIETLKKLGLNVKVIPTPVNFEEICEQTISLGKLIGYENQAQSIIRQTKESVNDIRSKSAGLPKKQRIFFQIGANPIFSVLQNTFMDDFILIVNGENIANGLKRGTMTRENVLVKNPDIIIIATMGGFGEEEMEVWKKYGEINAVKNERIFLIDSETACSPTPVNFSTALTDIYKFVSK